MHNDADSNGYREGGHGVAWQDELRQLGEEMAAGRISADEYRRRFDELTAQGGAQGATPPQDSPPEQDSTPRQAGTPQQDSTPPQASAPEQDSAPPQNGSPDQDSTPGQDPRNSPFPPAFKWDNTPNETTQVIQPVGNGDAESTQIVPAQPPPGPSYDDSERTQVVQAGPPGPPRYGQPTYSPGGFPGEGDQWAQQESAPPWVSSDPIQEPNAGWMMQGPEFFEPEPKESNVMRIVAVVAAVVVLLGIGAGAFFLFQPGGSETPAAGGDDTTAAQPPAPPPAQPPPATSVPPPANPAPPPPQGPPIAGLPGQQKDTSALRDFAQVRQIGYLTEGELETMYAAGPSDAAFALSDQDDNRLIILVVKAQDAVTAADDLADLQLQFELDEVEDAPAGVRTAGSDNVDSGDPVLRRAHYASGDYVVRVQASGNDISDVEALFQEILDAQLQKLSADG